MKILILSFYFPPHLSIASIRVNKTAKYLRALGHEVKVISAKRQPPGDLDVEIPTEDVQYTSWIKLAPEDGGGSLRSAVAGSNALYNFVRGCWRWIKSLLYFPDVFVGWLPFAIKAADGAVRTFKPDIIFVSVSPFSSLIAASRIAKQYHIPWVADFRDLWTSNQCYPFGPWRKRIEQSLERRILSSAAGVVTVSAPLAEKLKAMVTCPVGIVCNGFDPADYASEENKPNGKTTGLRIVYIGTIYDDFQDPRPLFEALTAFDPLEVKVAFYGTSSPRLKALVKKMGVEAWVDFVPQVSYKQSLKAQLQADILLFLLWTDEREKGVFTGKFFEYVGAGRPILGIGPDSCVAAQVIKERRIGFIVKESQAIRNLLSQWLTEKKLNGHIPSSLNEARLGFSRFEQTKVLEKFLTSILDKNNERC